MEGLFEKDILLFASYPGLRASKVTLREDDNKKPRLRGALMYLYCTYSSPNGTTAGSERSS